MELEECPEIHTKILVFSSATATFFAPSDECGIRGMQCEHIRSTHMWRNQGPHCNCALVVEDETKPRIKRLTPVHVILFFSFTHREGTYPCAFVEWFKN
jgi:hypothetical protein